MNKKILFLMIVTFFIFFTSLTCYSADANLQWDTSSGATGYRLYYGTSSGNYSDTVDVGGTTGYTLTGLDEKLTYYLVVRAYDSDGESGNSNELVIVATSSGSATPAVPSAPTVLRIVE